MHNCRLAPAPRTAGRRADPVAAGSQLSDPPVDGTAGNPGGPCRRAHTPIALGQRLVRREQTPSPFAEEVLKQLIPGSDVLNVDHPRSLFSWCRVAPREFVICSLRSSGQLDLFISPRILSSRLRGSPLGESPEGGALWWGAGKAPAAPTRHGPDEGRQAADGAWRVRSDVAMYSIEDVCF